MGIRIITDSSADFDMTDARARGVDIVPMTIRFGGTSFIDGRTLSHDAFYKLLQGGKTSPATSQPNPADFLPLFEAARDAGDQVVVVTLSSVLSGTIQSALIAREICGYQPVYIVDSLSATAGIQLLVDRACALRDAGRPAAEIAAELEALRGRVRIFAVIDTLEYLRRGGRLSSFQAGLGTVTRLKPVIAVRNGAVEVAAKAFGTEAASRQLLKLLEQHPMDGGFPVHFLYSTDRSRGEPILAKLREAGTLPAEPRCCGIGPTIGTHIGPNVFGFAYVETRR